MDRVLQALLRTELRFFIRKVFTTVSPGETYLHNWHVDAIAHQLMRVRSGESRRLLINQPPRSLKSICVSVAYVAWLLGHDPTRHVIVASYSGDFAAELHRQFRMVIASEWYAAVFPNLHLAKETGLELVTSQGGSRYATSVGGTLTGRGADLIIVDDPLNANEIHSETARKRVIDWYGGALVSRLNDKQTGSIIAVMQRLHEDDLAGHLLRQGGWNHLNMPAIALEEETIELGRGGTHVRRSGDILHPERESREALEAIKAEVGSLLFSAQYQQQPVPVEGNLIRRSWFPAYDALPAGPAGTRIVQSWDIVQRQDKMPVIVRIWPFDWAADLPAQEVRALLTLNALGPKPGPPAAILAKTFRLTPSEAKLACIIARGASPGIAAGELKISRETARNQLKSVFAKTDTHRQSELVALLLQVE